MKYKSGVPLLLNTKIVHGRMITHLFPLSLVNNMASQVQEVRSRDAYSGEKREQLRDGSYNKQTNNKYN